MHRDFQRRMIEEAIRELCNDPQVNEEGDHNLMEWAPSSHRSASWHGTPVSSRSVFPSVSWHGTPASSRVTTRASSRQGTPRRSFHRLQHAPPRGRSRLRPHSRVHRPPQSLARPLQPKAIRFILIRPFSTQLLAQRRDTIRHIKLPEL